MVTHISKYFKVMCVFIPSCRNPLIVKDVTIQFRSCCRLLLQFATIIVPVMPALHHLNLPEAFALHPQLILSIPGKILSSPGTSCDPFFYFTTPTTEFFFCDLYGQFISGKLNNIYGSLQLICHHINAYFSYPQTSKPITQITQDGNEV